MLFFFYFKLTKGPPQGVLTIDHITVGSDSYEKAENFKYLGCLLANQNYIHGKIKYTRNELMFT